MQRIQMENVFQKTALQIIDEIALLYTVNTRSTEDNDRCLYVGAEGRTCAFGYLCIDPSRLKEGFGAVNQLRNHSHEILKPEYRGYSFQFYRDLQYLHDNKNYWNETGLSERGNAFVDHLKHTYKDEIRHDI